MARTSFTLVLLSIAGLMALLLGIVGIYSVIAHSVSQRRREIGIRLALGASPGGLRRLFTRQAMGLVAIGMAVGLAAALGFTQLMDSLLFGVTPLDPATFLLVPLALAAVAALASYLPARRAVRVDPIETLRYE
jgi:ABC-type antimicrobial peptide transport system permease subunit